MDLGTDTKWFGDRCEGVRQTLCSILMCTFQKNIQRKPADDLSAGFSLCLNHRQITIHAKNVNLFRGSHAVAATGADIFACVARLWRRCGSGGVSVSCTARRVAPFDAVHVDVCPALFNDEIAKGIGRLCDAPPDARVVADGQVAGGSCIPEFFVVVCPAPAAILNAVLQIPEVYHFMQQSRRRVLDRPVKSSGPDVQFVTVFLPFAS